MNANNVTLVSIHALEDYFSKFAESPEGKAVGARAFIRDGRATLTFIKDKYTPGFKQNLKKFTKDYLAKNPKAKSPFQMRPGPNSDPRVTALRKTEWTSQSTPETRHRPYNFNNPLGDINRKLSLKSSSESESPESASPETPQRNIKRNNAIQPLEDDAQSIAETVVSSETSLPSKYLQQLAKDKNVFGMAMPHNSKNRAYIVQHKEESEWKVIRGGNGGVVENTGTEVDKINDLVLDKNKLQKVGDVYSSGKYRVTLWTKKVKVDYGDLLQSIQDDKEKKNILNKKKLSQFQKQAR